MTREHKTCIIIDDEPIAIRIIKEHLAAFDSLQCMDGFTNPVKAMEFLSTQRVDLIFLDINMPGISGIELLKTLQYKPAIIFTTAYREYAVDAFELDALDYLVKPISFERFARAVNKFLNLTTTGNEPPELSDDKKYIILKSDKKKYKVTFRDIEFIESLDNYIQVHTRQKGKLVCYETLSSIEQQLPGDDFLRIHRSFIINVHHIKAFTASYIEIGNIKLTIGRNYKEEVMKRLS
ncbi:LytTR family DNA-binding domain-containing protein [Marinilabilia sp.]|uniref:LytR/AlgR family response regulator transcription factor n=1 Tax=Marinilabilia sp. TaxID=2021252 RepID=UPI0025BB6ADF|nr:LytTR family DNA-binding domain-containing protein [Marinilabilia sp.]